MSKTLNSFTGQPAARGPVSARRQMCGPLTQQRLADAAAAQRLLGQLGVTRRRAPLPDTAARVRAALAS